MKAAFVGGGSHRLIRILRAALANPSIFDGGEIFLHDLNVARAEIVGRILKQTPEFRANPIFIRWGDSLEEALEGSSVVGVILMAGTALSFAQGNAACLRQGYVGSDNVSPNGAMLAVKGAPILLEIARKMAIHCPDAWLLDFANPVGVLSGMLNRHTRIRTLGVCAGFANHQWDLARIFGRDERSDAFKVTAAGVNHLSFIIDGTYNGRDLWDELDTHLAGEWQPPPFAPGWPDGFADRVSSALRRLIQLYQDYGTLIFSTEADGMMHFYYDEEYARQAAEIPSEEQIARRVADETEARKQKDAWFASHAARELDDAFWRQQDSQSPFSAVEDDVILRILRGASGVEPVDIVTSRLNEGAIEGFADDTVVEYSQRLYKTGIRPQGRFKLPKAAMGLTAALAEHQTLLGDACFYEDPRLLCQALQSYPVRPFSREIKALNREMLEINASQIPPALQGAREFLN